VAGTVLAAGLPLLCLDHPRAQSSDDCLACHGEASLSTERKGRSVSLHTDRAVLEASPHRDLACVDCHTGFDPASLPHAPKIVPVDCLACHDGVRERHSFHAGMALLEGKEARSVVDCKDCHGTHAVRGMHPPEPGARASLLTDSCGRCHEAEAAEYAVSEHGRTTHRIA
jgi:hypothetical protein